MYQVELKFDDILTDEPITETHYFHLSLTSLAVLQSEFGSDMTEWADFGKGADDEAEVMEAFFKVVQRIVSESHGVVVNKRFVRSEEATAAFMSGAAYDEFVLHLLNEPNRTLEFIYGIMPKQVKSQTSFDELLKAVNNHE